MPNLPPLPTTTSWPTLRAWANAVSARVETLGGVDLDPLPEVIEWDDLRPWLDAIEDRVVVAEQEDARLGVVEDVAAAAETPPGAQAKANAALNAAKAYTNGYAETPAGAQAKANAAEADAKAYAGTLAYGTTLEATNAVIDARTGSGERPVGRDELAVNVMDRGAVGDGVTDDTAAIQAAVNAGATFGLPAFFPAGRYRLTSLVTLPSGASVRGVGAGTVIDIVGLGSSTASPKTAFQAAGTIEAAQAISVDVPKGAKSVTLAASTTLVRGDFVKLSSDQLFHVTANLRRGEIKRVEAVSGTVVTFEDATYDSYAAGSGAKLQRMVPVQDITLADFTIEGTDDDNQERGVFIDRGDNIRITGVTFNYTDWNSINLRDVTNFKVTECTFRNVDWVSNGPNYYGLVVENASAHGVFANNHGTKCRHLFTTGYTQTVAGVARFVVVEGNVDTYSQSASYDTHDGSEFITFANNTSSYSEANGINCEGRETIVTGNQIIGHGTTGIYVRGGAENITISNNRVGNPTGAVAYSILVTKTHATHVPRRISVDGNMLSNAATHAVYAQNVEDLTIGSNTFAGVFTTYAIRVHNGVRTKITNNTGSGGTNSFIAMQDCVRTIIANNSAGTHNSGVRMLETATGLTQDTVIIGNDLSVPNPILTPKGTRKVVGNLGVADSSA
ncbi:right-handed parallel beta-helix repeat-containing protein [Ornithinimicrobium sp. LYQ92]|uniref:right-handed parallel beta-helix repeat-containing protein n=1 Tax=Serinicoccus sp. LYQ92 TaxID=3378798 RepID=UPI003854F159